MSPPLNQGDSNINSRVDLLRNGHGPRAALLEEALAYRRRGWSIIPVRGKQGAVRWTTYQTARPDEQTLREWFISLKAITGIAVLFGSVSGGLRCRDYDDLQPYHSWARAHHDLARTLPTAQTARGRHVYFRGGPETFYDVGDGEYRGTPGQYCLLPPSLHPDGPTYRWAVPLPDGPLPEIDPVREGLLPRNTECNTADSSNEGGLKAIPFTEA
jgi:hypothetical protein